MLALTEVQLDHVVSHRAEPSFGNLLTVAQAVTDIRAPADEAPVLVEVAQRTLGAGRRHFELVAGGKRIGLVEQRADRLAHPLAIGERHAFGPVNADS